VTAHFEVKSVSSACNAMTGVVWVEKSEGHIRSCTIVPESEWDTVDVVCDKHHWDTYDRCTADEVAFFDEPAHNPDTSSVGVAFKLKKISNLSGAQPTCSAVRAMNFDN